METLKTAAWPGRHRAMYWLIVERGPDRCRTLTLGTNPDEEALAVFSFEEEALLFLWVEGLAEGWEVTEVAADELAPALSNSCPNRVALDPLPGPLGGKMVGLLSMEREHFLTSLGRRRVSAMASPRPVERCDEKYGP
jgi:hypothetical protein